MKVILLQDVKKVGKKDQTVEVSDGFATNYLFPRKLAVQLTKKSNEVLSNQQEERRVQDENNRKNAIVLQEKLKSITVVFEVKAGSNDKIFGSISPKHIEEKLKDEFNVEIDKRKFLEKVQLDRIGFYRLKIELYRGVVGEINVQLKEGGK